MKKFKVYYTVWWKPYDRYKEEYIDSSNFVSLRRSNFINQFLAKTFGYSATCYEIMGEHLSEMHSYGIYFNGTLYQEGPTMLWPI